MWDYICPKCRKEVGKKSRRCPYCGERYSLPLRVPPRVLKDPEALDEYVHRHVFPKMSAAQREYLTQFFTTIFAHNFEGGNFGYDPSTGFAWDGTSGAASVQDTYKHHGTYAAKFTFAGGYQKAEAYYDFGTSYDHVFTRNYVMFRGSLPGTNQRHILIDNDNQSYGRLYAIRIFNVGGTLNLNLWRKFPSDASTWFPYAFQLDTWYCIDTEYLRDGQNGGYRAWLDGILACEDVGLNTSSWTHVEHFLGYNSDSHSAAHDVYFDCCVIADAYIGPEEGAVLKETSDACAVGDSVFGDKAFAVSDGVGLADVPLKHWVPQISDVVGFSDGVLSGKLLEIFDSLGLGGVVGLGKVLLVEDLLGLGDGVFVSKVLGVSDGVGLVEVVVGGVGGVVRTRVFLVLGDLAIQLCGG
jgi:DNA-directed RNA polymerase subunit RPC12/RpoP